MQKIKKHVTDLGQTIKQGQSASLLTAPAIAKKAATQSYVVIGLLLKEVEQLGNRINELEGKNNGA